MLVEPDFHEYADFCPVCTEMVVLCWIDEEVDGRVCDDCAESLYEAERVLVACGLCCPSAELIRRNP
jgi:hypothetical protein